MGFKAPKIEGLVIRHSKKGNSLVVYMADINAVLEQLREKLTVRPQPYKGKVPGDRERQFLIMLKDKQGNPLEKCYIGQIEEDEEPDVPF